MRASAVKSRGVCRQAVSQKIFCDGFRRDVRNFRSYTDAALARAKKRGATLMNGPMEVPGGSRRATAQLKDPQGATFALHQAS